MQGLAQRVTAVRPDLVNSNATFGELWSRIWGKGHASDGGTWPRRLLRFSGGELRRVGVGLPAGEGLGAAQRRVARRVTGAYLGFQVHPEQGGLVDEVIDWFNRTSRRASSARCCPACPTNSG